MDLDESLQKNDTFSCSESALLKSIKGPLQPVLVNKVLYCSFHPASSAG